MKLLIAYDGSNCSEAALDDLQQAGLPDEAKVLVMSVAEVWLPPAPKNKSLHQYVVNLQTHPQPFRAYQTGAKAVTEAEALVDRARQRLQRNFPYWQIQSEATYGSPAWEIVTRANDFKADLIILGSHGLSAINRLILGSISQKVLTEAHCSVRVARGRVEVDPYPTRGIIGFDGSPGSLAAIESVLSRNWREESEFKLISVIDPVVPSVIGKFIPSVTQIADEIKTDEREWFEKLAEPYLKRFYEAELNVTLSIYAGNPKQILVEEANNWHADCIFVGANALGNRWQQFLLGSVSAAVAARAHCSVEVVRKVSEPQQNEDQIKEG